MNVKPRTPLTTRALLKALLRRYPDMVYAEAARRLGVSRNRISQLARDLGCRRRKAGRRKAA